VRDTVNRSYERAMLIVQPPKPAAFDGDLALVPNNGLVEAFAAEIPAKGQAALPNPQTIKAADARAGKAKFFVEGTSPSNAVRDTGFKLGIQNLEPDADRVAMTNVQIEVTETADVAAAALTFVRYGLWDQGYDAGENIKDGATEAASFVGSDKRKFHLRVRDRGATGSASVNWKTVKADRVTDDDAPASQLLTLPETSAGSKLFISRAVMLVIDDVDRDQPTNSGLNAPFDTGARNFGQSNHRTRRALIDGFVRAEYLPSAGVRLTLTVPIFNRDPDERKRVKTRVIRYTNAADPVYVPATDAYIAAQFEHSNQRWNQVGVQIDREATVDRQVPVAALQNHQHPFDPNPNNPREVAMLTDLIPIIPDNTIAVVFVDMRNTNAFTETDPVNPINLPDGTVLNMDQRFFIFVQTALDLFNETLAHEFHHALFNRFDAATQRRFFTLNTRPPNALIQGTGIVLPDPRIYRRFQNLNSPDPNNDPNNDNIINWVRRVRSSRYPAASGLGAATATTGNTLLQNF
jgi:hypothetical protein